MNKIKFPVVEIEGNRFQLTIDTGLYAKEAVTATCYKYSDRYFIHQQLIDEKIVVVFEANDGKELTETTPKQFCNDLIDQQLRVDVNKEFGHIRDLIVEEAFKPVSK